MRAIIPCPRCKTEGATSIVTLDEYQCNIVYPAAVRGPDGQYSFPPNRNQYTMHYRCSRGHRWIAHGESDPLA